MTQRDRSAILRGAAVLIAAFGALRVAPGAIGYVRAAERDVREQGDLLARAETEVAQTRSLADSAATLARALVAIAPRLLSADGRSDALATLSGNLSLAASQAGVRVAQVEQLPDSLAVGRLRRVWTRASLEGDVRGLAEFLGALASGQQSLVLDEIQVQAPAPFAGDRDPEVLRWEVTVSGWYVATS